MADPFATGLGVLFKGPCAVAALYYPSDGSQPIQTSVIRSQADERVRFGEGEALLNADRVEIQRRDVAAPVEGDEIQLFQRSGAAGDRLVIAGDPETDLEAMTWHCPVSVI